MELVSGKSRFRQVAATKVLLGGYLHAYWFGLINLKTTSTILYIGLQTKTSCTMSTKPIAFNYFRQAQTEFKPPPLPGNDNAFLGDIATRYVPNGTWVCFRGE